MNNDISALQRILRDCRTIAVVGLSADSSRPSFSVAKYLQGFGYRIIPVNPRYAATHTAILGEVCYATLAEIPVAVDMVDVFRKADDVLPIAREAIAIGAKCLWQQLGVGNLEADALAREAGLDSFYNRCVKIEHARFNVGLNGGLSGDVNVGLNRAGVLPGRARSTVGIEHVDDVLRDTAPSNERSK